MEEKRNFLEKQAECDRRKNIGFQYYLNKVQIVKMQESFKRLTYIIPFFYRVFLQLYCLPLSKLDQVLIQYPEIERKYLGICRPERLIIAGTVSVFFFFFFPYPLNLSAQTGALKPKKGLSGYMFIVEGISSLLSWKQIIFILFSLSFNPCNFPLESEGNKKEIAGCVQPLFSLLEVLNQI